MTQTHPAVPAEDVLGALPSSPALGDQPSWAVWLARLSSWAGVGLLTLTLFRPELAGTWTMLLATIGLVTAGALTSFWLRSRLGEPSNNGVFFSGMTNRGAGAWLTALALTGFYCILYWWNEDTWGTSPLYGAIQLVEPLSQLLRERPADRWFLYGFAYTFGVALMGARMLWRYRGERYHLWRTSSLVAAQLLLAFLLPALFQRLDQPDFYLSYFWPLKPEYLLPFGVDGLISAGSVGRAMLLWSAAASFVAVPLLTWRFGKRWYCSWICGCGGLAETVGDPFRHLASTSVRAWRIERWSIHLVLLLIVLVSGALWLNQALGRPFWGDGGSAFYYRTYGFLIGAAFSGVVGVGFYPLLGSRVWCRFGCPQAAVLGVLQRWFSRFRITTNGGQCISCGSCSTYCEMGIDVRAYAQRGMNIVRASCVGCGVCASVCPRGVLRLENGSPADRYDGADQPLFDMLRSMGVLKRDPDDAAGSTKSPDQGTP